MSECRRETDRLNEEVAHCSAAKRFFDEEKMNFDAQLRRSVDEILRTHARMFADRMLQAPLMGQISTETGSERSTLFIPTDGGFGRVTVESRGKGEFCFLSVQVLCFLLDFSMVKIFHLKVNKIGDFLWLNCR